MIEKSITNVEFDMPTTICFQSQNQLQTLISRKVKNKNKKESPKSYKYKFNTPEFNNSPENNIQLSIMHLFV